MDERDKNLLNIGVLLSEDMERIEVMYEGFDMGCFILGMLDAEMRGLNSPRSPGTSARPVRYVQFPSARPLRNPLARLEEPRRRRER